MWSVIGVPVANVRQQRNCRTRRVQVFDRGQDVEDGLGRQSWNGSGADVLNVADEPRGNVAVSRSASTSKSTGQRSEYGITSTVMK